MTELTDLLRKIGFADAETYIQSGNIVFTCPEANVEEVSANIAKAIRSEFSHNITVITRTSDQLKEIISANPFLEEPGFDPSRMAVIFLESKPDEDKIQKMSGIDYSPDKFLINNSEIYIYCPNGFGKTKLYTNFFESKMKVKGTARNWRTVKKLFEIAGNKNLKQQVV
jgi:uncharacterized protein (DUF1697 family)